MIENSMTTYVIYAYIYVSKRRKERQKKKT